MLLKRALLERIAAGEVDVVFRRWKRPTVRSGGSLRTAVGMLAIDAVDRVSLRAVTVAEARRAGYESKAALERDLSQRQEGEVYRIRVHLAGPDPRLELRERAELTDDEMAELRARLDRLDRASVRGPWTVEVLRLLAANPRVRAQDLAERLGREKPAFKYDVRKLKELGLTISHSPGYLVSPRGRALLEALDE